MVPYPLTPKLTYSKHEVRELLVDGFMPRVSLTGKPAARHSGFQEFGLPYAADPAMTRYLAAFLVAHRWAALMPLPRWPKLSHKRWQNRTRHRPLPNAPA